MSFMPDDARGPRIKSAFYASRCVNRESDAGNRRVRALFTRLKFRLIFKKLFATR